MAYISLNFSDDEKRNCNVFLTAEGDVCICNEENFNVITIPFDIWIDFKNFVDNELNNVSNGS